MGEKKNVLLVTIDSLRADHVSCLGYHRRTTPHIDNLAETGVLFTQAIANGSLTPTSFPSLLTSTYPMMYGYHPHLSKYKTTVAEVLAANGYNTAAFHSNPYLSRYYGYDRGFHTFEDFIFSELGLWRRAFMENIDRRMTRQIARPLLPKKASRLVRGFVHRRLEFLKPQFDPYENADIINEKAVLWLRQNTDKFFLWVHYMDVHHPYLPRHEHLQQMKIKSFTRSQTHKLSKIMVRELLNNVVHVSERDLQRLMDLYDGEIRYTDDAVGALFAELQNLGAYDDTLIIVTADHGDEFNEHEALGHQAKLYDELIRVPLIIKCPGLDEGVLIDHQAQLLDIAPTILGFLGIERPKSFQGTSLMSLTHRKSREITNPEGVISEALRIQGKVYRDGSGERLTSYRTVGWKYILDEGNDTEELYNLQNDPKEKINLADEESQKAAEYRSIIVKHIRREEKSKDAVITAEKEKIRHKIDNLKRTRLA